MYARVPAIDGVPQVGEVRLITGISISSEEAVVHIIGEKQEGWTELTEEEYTNLGGTLPTASANERITQLETIIDDLFTGGE